MRKSQHDNLGAGWGREKDDQLLKQWEDATSRQINDIAKDYASIPKRRLEARLKQLVKEKYGWNFWNGDAVWCSITKNLWSDAMIYETTPEGYLIEWKKQIRRRDELIPKPPHKLKKSENVLISNKDTKINGTIEKIWPKDLYTVKIRNPKHDTFIGSEESLIKLAKESLPEQLLLASEKGDYRKIRALLTTKDLKLNVANEKKRTALIIASMHGHQKAVRTILTKKDRNKNFDVDHLCKEGKSAILYAAENDHANIVEILLDAGASFGITDNNENNLLHLAANNGHYDVLKRVSVLNDYKRMARQLFNTTNRFKFTPLMCAAQNGKARCVEYILGLQDQETVDAVEIKNGQSALHLAFGYLDQTFEDNMLLTGADHQSDAVTTLMYLLDNNNVDINLANNRGNTLLHLVCGNEDRDYMDIFKKILKDRKTMLNIANKVGHTPLHIATSYGHAHIVKRLLKRGANVNVVDKDGFSPLMRGSELGQMECVKTLIEAHANVEIMSTKMQETALTVAAISEKNAAVRISIVKLLLNAGAGMDNSQMARRQSLLDVTIRGDAELVNMFTRVSGSRVDCIDAWGWSPLIWAADKGHFLVLETLIDSNANINHRNHFGGTALMRAAKGGNVDCVKHLLNYQADPSLTKDGNLSALFLAVKQRHHAVVKILLRRLDPKDILLRDKNDNTILHAAAKNGDIQMFQMLLGDKRDPDNPSNLLEAWQVEDLVNSTNWRMISPLAEAAKHKFPDVVDFLILQDADVNASSIFEMTPAWWAVKNKDLKSLRLLVNNSARLDLLTWKGRTLLHTAASVPHSTRVLDFILDRGLMIEKWHHYTENEFGQASGGEAYPHYVNQALRQQGECVYFPTGKLNNGVSICAARDTAGLQHVFHNGKKARKVKHLHERAIDWSDNLKQTPLHVACMRGSTDVIDRLLSEVDDEHDAMSARDANKFTPFGLALQNNNLEVVKYFNEVRSELVRSDLEHTIDGKSPLYTASKYGAINVVKYLVNHMTRQQVEDLKEFIPIVIAAKKNHHAVVQALVSKSDVNMQNTKGYTALNYTCKYGHVTSFEALTENYSDEIDFDLPSKHDDKTPLMHAVQFGNLFIVNSLLKHDVKVNMQDKDGKTALMYALEEGKSRIAARLLDDINRHDLNLKAKPNENEHACSIQDFFKKNRTGHSKEFVKLFRERLMSDQELP